MHKIQVFDQNLKEVKEIEINDAFFNLEINDVLLSQVSDVLRSNLRKTISSTKTRSEVSGGGKKPWKQKGTGRARHGSNRSPIWVGGGIAFGPDSERNYHKRINKKQKQKAFFMLIANKLRNNALLVLSDINLNEPKTKNVINILGRTDFKDKDSIIFATYVKKENLLKSVSNLPRVGYADILSPLDLLKYKNLIITEEYFNEILNNFEKFNS
ncbi:50S ribosomal protein L4 [bacterium]|nr:50S ribosomal protein L4 [bacterium]